MTVTYYNNSIRLDMLHHVPAKLDVIHEFRSRFCLCDTHISRDFDLLGVEVLNEKSAVDTYILIVNILVLTHINHHDTEVLLR